MAIDEVPSQGSSRVTRGTVISELLPQTQRPRVGVWRFLSVHKPPCRARELGGWGR